ncbi:MAG: hypothetical protein E7430_01935 [Ruminococcaceae bacterium]|nr:hypothetical protein [Oscillospiraceae bacterium]
MENINTEALLKRIEKLEEDAARADDYREICNCMAGHCFCYNSHDQAYEIETFWTKEKQDAYYNGNTTPEGVAYYYINNTKALRAKQREIVNRVYDMELTEEDKVGYRVVNMLGTPFIEIAKDRQTAQGVWMTFNVLCHVDNDGKPQPSVSVGKICAEFCRENGKWKLWRFRGCPGGFDLDVKLSNDGTDKASDDADKNKMNFGLPKFTEEEEKILNKRRITKEYALYEMGYQPWNPAVADPPLPMPYDTWDDSQSFFQFID